jgi:putative membrane protein
MKNSTLTILAAGALLCGLGSCSSTNTETTTTPPAEEVATDRTTAPSPVEVVGNVDTPNGSDSVAAPTDSISFHALAASSDVVEILSSVQAKAKARNAEVKKFAEQMITDHTKTSDELKQIATKRNLKLPNTPLGMHQRMLNKVINEKDMDEFDEEYMDMQVTMHQQAVALFEEAAKDQSDPELKAFATKHLPHLKMHLDMAKKTKALVK